MIHTIHLDDKYVNIKYLLEEIRRQEQGVLFEQPMVANKAVQEEYMTSKEFWEEADKRITKVCKQYGVLQ
ncbi:MAG: hypothetical protein FWD09_05220 [Lentimicrobiaceae bacterium]|nr:hypothetical protein [Lentimicrobiaceae bacterium]